MANENNRESFKIRTVKFVLVAYEPHIDHVFRLRRPSDFLPFPSSVQCIEDKRSDTTGRPRLVDVMFCYFSTLTGVCARNRGIPVGENPSNRRRPKAPILFYLYVYVANAYSLYPIAILVPDSYVDHVQLVCARRLFVNRIYRRQLWGRG